MKHELLQSPTNKTMLTVPGLDGSGPDHWQTLWEERFLNCQRVQMDDWVLPEKDKWVRQLDDAVRSANSPVVLVAHSLGCTTVAWWAQQRWSLDLEDKVLGALLVAPPDIERPDAPNRIASFNPAPTELLPFKSLLVASRNDPYAGFHRAEHMAWLWGSELVDLGNSGHINANSDLGAWEDGLSLVSKLVARRAPDSIIGSGADWRRSRTGPALWHWPN